MNYIPKTVVRYWFIHAADVGNPLPSQQISSSHRPPNLTSPCLGKPRMMIVSSLAIERLIARKAIRRMKIGSVTLYNASHEVQRKGIK
jgi:hypothetical protein